MTSRPGPSPPPSATDRPPRRNPLPAPACGAPQARADCHLRLRLPRRATGGTVHAPTNARRLRAGCLARRASARAAIARHAAPAQHAGPARASAAPDRHAHRGDPGLPAQGAGRLPGRALGRGAARDPHHGPRGRRHDLRRHAHARARLRDPGPRRPARGPRAAPGPDTALRRRAARRRALCLGAVAHAALRQHRAQPRCAPRAGGPVGRLRPAAGSPPRLEAHPVRPGRAALCPGRRALQLLHGG